MGLIAQLLLLPVAPLRFTVWVSDQLADEVDRQHGSPGAVTQRLQEIEESRERGEIDAEKAEQLEGETIEQVAGPATGPQEDADDG